MGKVSQELRSPWATVAAILGQVGIDVQYRRNRHGNQRSVGDAVFEIGIVEDALQAVGLGHLVLMHEGFMRTAQWGGDVQTHCLQLWLGQPVTATPSGRGAGGAMAGGWSGGARLKMRPASGLGATRGYRFPGRRFTARFPGWPGIRVSFGTNAGMQVHRRGSQRRSDGGETEGQDKKRGNVERTSHVVGAIAEVRGES